MLEFVFFFFFFFQAEDGIRDRNVTGVQTCALPIYPDHAPLCCWRMIGITCLEARMQLLRLIATQRSKASSVIASSSASPPERLTPTLLCRISMRPQRSCASATMALISASLVTSALEATAVPPLAAIMSTVSCAEARL